jgi:hypothetical protein
VRLSQPKETTMTDGTLTRGIRRGVVAMLVAGLFATLGCGDKKSDDLKSADASEAKSSAPKGPDPAKALTEFIDGLAKDAKGTYEKEQSKTVRYKGVVKYLLATEGPDQVHVIDKVEEGRPYVVCATDEPGLSEGKSIEIEGKFEKLWEAETTIKVAARAKISPCKVIK